MEFEHGTVSVEKEISRDLWEAAMLREFERAVQLARKEMGLKKADRILLQYAAPAELAEVLDKHSAKLKADVGAESVSMVEHVSCRLTKELELEGERLTIGLDRLA